MTLTTNQRCTMQKIRLRLFLCFWFLGIPMVCHISAFAAEFTLRRGTLWYDNRPILQNVPDTFSMEKDPTGTGVFLKFTAGNSSSFIQTPLCTIEGMRRFTSTYRAEPFWMNPLAGLTYADVKPETQWLLAETESGDLVQLVPMIDAPMRFSIAGSPTGLVLTGETGDPFTVGAGGVAVFVSIGRDPYKLAFC